MHISQLKESKFLKKEDCGDGILVTIRDVTQENVAKEGSPADMKWAIHFAETDKPMICNSTNGQIIAKITGSEETDNWAGSKIVLYNDPSITFGGKLMGGIRARAPRGQAAKAAPARPAAPPQRPSKLAEELPPPMEDDTDSEVPFL